MKGPMDEHFQLMGLDLSANKTDVLKAYRELAKKLHPDIGGSNVDFRALIAARDQLLLVTSDEELSKVEDSVPIEVELDLSDIVLYEDSTIKQIKTVDYKSCKVCFGTGSLDVRKDKQSCRNCEGRGIFKNVTLVGTTTTICGQCKGQGTEFLNPCKLCDGKGYLIVTEILKIKIDKFIIPETTLDNQLITVDLSTQTTDHRRKGLDLYIKYPIKQLNQLIGEIFSWVDPISKKKTVLPKLQTDKIFLKNMGLQKGTERGDLFLFPVIEKLPLELPSYLLEALQQFHREKD